MDIDLPAFVPAAPAHVDSSAHAFTSVPDVYRLYDVNKSERSEPAAAPVEAPEPAK